MFAEKVKGKHIGIYKSLGKQNLTSFESSSCLKKTTHFCFLLKLAVSLTQ